MKEILKDVGELNAGRMAIRALTEPTLKNFVVVVKMKDSGRPERT